MKIPSEIKLPLTVQQEGFGILSIASFAASYYWSSQWSCSPVLMRFCWKVEIQSHIFLGWDPAVKIPSEIKLPLTVQQEGFGILSIASFAASYYWGSQWGCSPVLMRFCCYSGIYCSRGSVFLGSHGLFFCPILQKQSIAQHTGPKIKLCQKSYEILANLLITNELPYLAIVL